MSVPSPHPELDDLATEMFRQFSRVEYALKAVGLLVALKFAIQWRHLAHARVVGEQVGANTLGIFGDPGQLRACRETSADHRFVFLQLGGIDFLLNG